MDDEAMLWTMRRCDGAMLPHRRIVHSIAFYAYVRSKQSVRDTVGPLEHNASVSLLGHHRLPVE